MRNDRKIASQSISRNEGRITNRPVLQSVRGIVKTRWIVIDKGNTLEEGSDGIKYVASVTSVPTAYDPDAVDTFIDGVGRGTLYLQGVAQTGYVLVVNSDAGTFRNALVQSDVVWVGNPIPMPVDGGGSVQVYTVM